MQRLVSQTLGIFSRLLYKQTILVLMILFCAGVAGALWNMSSLSSNLISSQALQNATLYAEALKESRTLYSASAVSRIGAVGGVTVTHDYATKEGAIPLPATFLIELGSTITKKNPGMSIRLYSDYPFPWRQAEGGPRDNFEQEALRYLRQHPDRPFVRLEKFSGRPALRYAEADTMKPSCISCHNTHPDSPKKDWQVGDVRGILEISQPLDSFITQTQAGLRETFVTSAGISLLGLSGLTLVIGRLRQTSKDLERQVIKRTAQLQEAYEELTNEQEKSERLLLNILPQPIAKQLKEGHSNIVDGFAEVTILFADIVGFTQLSELLSPTQLLNLLNELFCTFDCLSERYGLEKIKTIGDAYMVVGGLPTPRQDHAEAIAEMALDMQQKLAYFNATHGTALRLRIGINTGPAIAGVIGSKKFIYDLWGDAVNTASRMESHGIPDAIQVTEATYFSLKEQYVFECRGSIPIKGKGEMTAYLLKGRK